MVSAQRGMQARGWREVVPFITLTCSVSGEKGKQALRSLTLGLQVATVVPQHRRNPPSTSGNFFGTSWGAELSVTPLSLVVHSLLRAVPGTHVVKQLMTSCLTDFTWFILHPASPTQALCVTRPAVRPGQGRGNARTGARGGHPHPSIILTEAFNEPVPAADLIKKDFLFVLLKLCLILFYIFLNSTYSDWFSMDQTAMLPWAAQGWSAAWLLSELSCQEGEARGP